jgi:uncharacterized protein YuzE
MNPKVRYDQEAQAIYVRLSDKAYAYGEDIDHERRVDYADDGTPVGVEFLCVDEGVDLSDIPQADAIADALRAYDIRVLA